MINLSRDEKNKWFKRARIFLKQNGHPNITRGWVEIAELLEPLVGVERPLPSNRKDRHREWAIVALSILLKIPAPPEIKVGGKLTPEEITAHLVENEKRLKISAALSQNSAKDKYQRFYRCYDWRRLRFATLEKYGRRCMCCGKTTGVFNVDHIKPLRKNWDLRLDPNNLQVLCDECNHGKGNWSGTDFRPVVVKLTGLSQTFTEALDAVERLNGRTSP